jgi:hypothetical protein
MKGTGAMANNAPTNRARSIAGNVLILLPGIAVTLSETAKLLHVPAVVQQMAAAGFDGGKLILVGALGFTSALLFLFPRTRSIGLLLLSAFLGGAICLHVQRSEFTKALGPALLLGMAWIGTSLRHPQMLWSFGNSTAESSHVRQHDLASGKA